MLTRSSDEIIAEVKAEICKLHRLCFRFDSVESRRRHCNCTSQSRRMFSLEADVGDLTSKAHLLFGWWRLKINLKLLLFLKWSHLRIWAHRSLQSVESLKTINHRPAQINNQPGDWIRKAEFSSTVSYVDSANNQWVHTSCATPKTNWKPRLSVQIWIIRSDVERGTFLQIEFSFLSRLLYEYMRI